MYDLFDIEKIKSDMGNRYFIIYLNYEKKDGIEIAESFDRLENSLGGFYKVYIFNEEKMYTCVNFGKEKKMMFTSVPREEGEVRKIYIASDEITKVKGKDYRYINVRTGMVGEKEIFQYTGLGGGK